MLVVKITIMSADAGKLIPQIRTCSQQCTSTYITKIYCIFFDASTYNIIFDIFWPSFIFSLNWWYWCSSPKKTDHPLVPSQFPASGARFRLGTFPSPDPPGWKGERWCTLCNTQMKMQGLKWPLGIARTFQSDSTFSRICWMLYSCSIGWFGWDDRMVFQKILE